MARQVYSYGFYWTAKSVKKENQLCFFFFPQKGSCDYNVLFFSPILCDSRIHKYQLLYVLGGHWNAPLLIYFSLLSLDLQRLTIHQSNMWTQFFHPCGLPSYKPWGGAGLQENVLYPAKWQNYKLKSMCVTSFLQGHKLSKFCAVVKPSAPLKQSSALVMWVHYRKRPILLPSLVSPPFTSQWTGINATPLLGFLHDLTASMRTEMVSEG